MPDQKTIRSLENLRNRMRDLLEGDKDVDLGCLLHALNEDIGKLGGTKVELHPEEKHSRFFREDI